MELVRGSLWDWRRCPPTDNRFEVRTGLRSCPVRRAAVVDLAPRDWSLFRNASLDAGAFVSRTTFSPSKSDARRIEPSSTRITRARSTPIANPASKITF
jgi:hypothetical protein